MTRQPTVLTIIVNYRTAEITLKSIAAARVAMDGIAGAITVVDNDSQDGSYQKIAAHIAQECWAAEDRVRLIAADCNGGFGAGNNVGIQARLPDGSAPDYIYTLNSDAFPAPDAIWQLVNHLENTPEAAFAGSYIHGPDGDTHLTSFRFPSIASEFEGSINFGPITRLLKHRRVPIDTPNESTTVDWLAGASILMRQTVLDEIGLFDEAFFLYFEETDLCLRAKRAGYRTDYIPASRVAHIGSVSTGMKTWTRVPDYWFDSRWLYFCKNHGTAYAVLATLHHLVGGSLHVFRCLITGKQRAFAPGFLIALCAHDAKALLRRNPAQGKPNTANIAPNPRF